MAMTMGLAAPGGTPREIVDPLDAAIKKAAQGVELKTKTYDLGMMLR